MSIFPRFIDDGGTNRPYADDESGSLQLRSECCCGCVDTTGTCTNCDDLKPDEYVVTFEGVTLCGCVGVDYIQFGGSSSDVTLNFVLNAAHTLTYDGSCVWSKTITNGLSYQAYDDGACTTPTTNGDQDVDVTITLTRNATTWDLEVLSSANEQLFTDTQTADTSGADQLCATVPDFENDLAVGDCVSAVIATRPVAYDGTATVVCV